MAGLYKTGGPKAALGKSENASEREDLANFISMITRDETPFMSSIGKTKATAVLHEWQTDELVAPKTNARVEGLDFDNSGFTEDTEDRTRLGNFTQISAKKLTVTGTKRAVDQAGVADEYAYQLKKRGTEMRRDVEFDLVNGWNDKTSGQTRTFGGVQSYADSDNVFDAIGNGLVGNLAAANTTWETQFGADGDFGTIPSIGTRVTIGLSDIDTVMQAIYESGGKAGKIMVSPKNRREISSQAQAAGNVRRDIGESGTLRQSVDVYMSDFGDLMVVPNYIMGLGAAGQGELNAADTPADLTAIIYDPMWFNVATLRPMQEVDVGQKGDSTVGMILEECTLEVRNPKGFGMIVGIGA